MALNFPLNPTVGQTYQTGSSATYEFTDRNYWEIIQPSDLLVISASYAETASYALNGGGGGTSVLLSASAPVSESLGTLWFNTSANNANGGELYILVNETSSNWIPVFDSIINNATSASHAISASYALTASSAVSSSLAISASFAVTASSAVSSSRAISSSFAITSSTNTLAYANVTLGGTWPTSNDTDITISSVTGSGVTVATNVLTLQNAGVYYLSANLGIPSNNFAEYAWTAINGVRFSGTNIGISVPPTASQTNSPCTAAGIILATAGTQLKLRTITVNSGIAAQTPYYYNVQIIQLR